MSRLFAALPTPIIRWLGAQLHVPTRASRSLGLRARTCVACAVVCAGAVLVASTQSACGGDDNPPPQDAGVQFQGTKPPVTATAGTQSTASFASVELEPSLACGPSLCARPKNVAAQLLMSITGLPMTGAETVACCLDEDAGTCSSAPSSGASCDNVAVADNRCPGVDLSALSNLVGGLGDSAKEAMVGCCTHDMCGLDGKLFGRGCVENAEAKRMLSAVPVIGPLISVPPPRACAATSQPDAGAATKPASDEDAG